MNPDNLLNLTNAQINFMEAFLLRYPEGTLGQMWDKLVGLSDELAEECNDDTVPGEGGVNEFRESIRDLEIKLGKDVSVKNLVTIDPEACMARRQSPTNVTVTPQGCETIYSIARKGGLTVMELHLLTTRLLAEKPEMGNKPVALCLPQFEPSETNIVAANNEGDDSILWLKLSPKNEKFLADTPEVAVFAEGGLVTKVKSNRRDTIVSLVDADNVRENEDPTQRDVDAAWKKATQYTPHEVKLV